MKKQKLVNWSLLILIAFISVLLTLRYSSSNRNDNVHSIKNHIKQNLNHNNDTPIVISRIDSIKVEVVSDSIIHVIDSLKFELLKHNKSNATYNIDTARVVYDYFSRRSYLISKSLPEFDFTMPIDVYKNKIVYGKFSYKVHSPSIINKTFSTSVITYLEEPPDYNIYIGVGFGGSSHNMNNFSPGIIYTKQKTAYMLGYNILENRLNVQLGFYYKLY